MLGRSRFMKLLLDSVSIIADCMFARTHVSRIPRKLLSVSLTMIAKLMLADISLLPDARCQLRNLGARIKSYSVSSTVRVQA